MAKQKIVEAGKPASTPLTLHVRFVGGSLDGREQEATFRVADLNTLSLLDIRATFGGETYKFNLEQKTFVLEGDPNGK